MNINDSSNVLTVIFYQEISNFNENLLVYFLKNNFVVLFLVFTSHSIRLKKLISFSQLFSTLEKKSTPRKFKRNEFSLEIHIGFRFLLGELNTE